MVKAGAKRAAKFALKFDAYVNMIRSKHEHFLINRLFMETTYKQAFLDRSVQDIAAKCSIGWGSKANLEKYAELYLWKGQGTLADFLAAGLNLCAYNEVIQLPAKYLSLFYVCTYPRSQAKITLSVAPLPNQVPLTSRADWLAQLTAGSEHEANLLLAIPNKLSILNAQVCAHNVANNLALFLNNPVVAVTGYGVNPILHRALAWGLVPNLYPIFSNSKTLYAVQNVTLTIGISKTLYAVQNVTLTIGISSAHPNVNNFQPILNSSVAHS